MDSSPVFKFFKPAADSASTKTSYGIVEANTIQDLVDSVNVKISGGWKPLGGPSITQTTQGQNVYIQAVEK